MFSKVQFVAIISSLAAISTAAPSRITRLRRDGNLEGPYQGDASLAARKQQLVSWGATAYDLSVTFIEHGDLLAADPSQNGANAQNIGLRGDPGNWDSANFGMFNNNWYMIRSHCDGFTQYGPTDWAKGAALNDDPEAAVKCQVATRNGFQGNWAGVQRSGQSMCNSASIQAYSNAVNTIVPYNQAHMNDSMWESYNVVFQGSC